MLCNCALRDVLGFLFVPKPVVSTFDSYSRHLTVDEVQLQLVVVTDRPLSLKTAFATVRLASLQRQQQQKQRLLKNCNGNSTHHHLAQLVFGFYAKLSL